MVVRKLKRFLLAVAVLVSTAAQAQLSSDISIDRGKLSVLIKDSVDFKRHAIEVYVEKGNKRYKLNFPKGKDLYSLRSGMVVKVKGKKLRGEAVSVGSDPSSFQVVSGAEVVGVGGTKQALVLKIKSASAVTSASDASIAGVLVDADGWFRESSFGMLSMKNDWDANGVADIFTVSIPDNSLGAAESMAFTYCNSAKNAAKSQLAIDPALWDHVLCVLPPDMNYSWFGQAYVPGKDIVISGKYAGGYPGGYTHEIAHNLGMHHANTPGTEYGESAAVMGGNAGTGRRDFNGPHKTQMAWLPLSNAGAGNYEINAVEAQPGQRVSSHSVLKIRDQVANEDLYISYRSPLGTFGAGLNIPYRTSIHRWPGSYSRTEMVANIGDGESFSRNGITITQLAHTNVSASLSIGAVCSAAAPAVVVDPASFVTNSAGEANVTVTVSNNDVNCSEPTSFAISAQVPSGLTATLGSTAVSVAPGQSAALSLKVAAASGLASGSYPVSVAVSAAGHPTGSGAISYVLDTAAPNAVNSLKGAADRKGKVNLSWSAPSDLGSGVGSYQVFRNQVLIATVANLSYSDAATGTNSYYVVAVDKAGNRSGNSNVVSVSIATKGRK